MGAVLCTLITLPFQILLQFVIPMLQQVAVTICNWVTTVVTTIRRIVERICNWLPWPFNLICNLVTRIIRVVETIWDWICNTVIRIIITFITVFVSVIYYISQIVCTLINIGIGSPAWLLCLSGVSPPRRINVCVKILTDVNGFSGVTELAIRNNIQMLRELYFQCGIEVNIVNTERIINPNLLTGTTCSFWGLFSTWHAWFAQNSCLCCNTITVFFVDDIINASGCAYWGDNFCRVDSGANNDPTLVAHEIGHLLGLSHSTDPNNLMTTEFNPKASIITQNQCCTMKLSPYVI